MASRSKRMRTLARCSVILLLLLLAVSPWLVAGTPLRNGVLNLLLGPLELRGSIAELSCGWLSPLQLSGLELARDDGRLRARVERVEFEQSWPRLWWGLPDLGAARLDRPQLEIVVNEQPPYFPAPARRRESAALTLSASVRQASVNIRVAEDREPIVDVENLDATAHIERVNGERFLRLEPVTVFDHQPLTPELCARGLQLIAPLLAHSTHVEGEGSLAFQQFRIPLDRQDPDGDLHQAEIEGTLAVHRLQASLRNPFGQQFTSIAAAMFQQAPPRTLQMLNESRVDFHLRSGRVYHEGMTFVLPEIAPDLVWKTHGSVGLDETLDITVETQLPESIRERAPWLRRLIGTPLAVRVTGTLDQPRVVPPHDRSWLHQWTGSVVIEALPEEQRPLAKAVWGKLGELLESKTAKPDE